jgi:hypothetical protein
VGERSKEDVAVGEDLAVLQAEFPAFRIWEEQMPGRIRYVARSRTDDVNPHTVITADLDELRGALQPSLVGCPRTFTGPADTITPGRSAGMTR